MRYPVKDGAAQKKTKHTFGKAAAAFALTIALTPCIAFAAPNTHMSSDSNSASDALVAASTTFFAKDEASIPNTAAEAVVAAGLVEEQPQTKASESIQKIGDAYDGLHQELMRKHDELNRRLDFDRSLIDQVGTQERTGHSVCCAGFACAYGDAVMDGTVHDHGYYGCTTCVWTDWGGGNSSFRSLGSSQDLLREAYDQINSGKPTVIHVGASYGQHWITLIGYCNAVDPDNLTLDNFIALDPWDGSELIAGSKFSLYGDHSEHISDR